MHSFTLLISFLSVSFTAMTLAAPILPSKTTVFQRQALNVHVKALNFTIKSLILDAEGVTNSLNALFTATDMTSISNLAGRIYVNEQDEAIHRVVIFEATQNTVQEGNRKFDTDKIDLGLFGKSGNITSPDPASFLGKLQIIIDAPGSGTIINELAKEMIAARFVMLQQKDTRTYADSPSRNKDILPFVRGIMNVALDTTFQESLTLEEEDSLRGLGAGSDGHFAS
jgi:hypothetical protein